MNNSAFAATPVELLVVVLNYRTADLTCQCLQSVFREVASGLPASIVLVDNHSLDGSEEKLHAFILRVARDVSCDLVVSNANLGFAGGNNLGIRHGWQRFDDAKMARPDFVLLLNSDTIVHRGCLARCIDVMKSDSGIGALSCRLLNADGSLQVVCRKFPNPLRLILGATGLPWKLPKLFSWADTEYHSWNMEKDSGAPDWIGGAFMMLRRETLEQVELLDEDFFFYGEDIELCYRVRRAGWAIRYEPSVTTTHLGGSSSDESRMLNEAKSLARWRARYLFLRKSYGRLAMWIVRVADISGLAARRFILTVSGRSNSVRAQSLSLAFRTLTGRHGPLF